MSTALTLQQAQPAGITSIKDLQEISSVFVKSGFFADTKDAAQAMVKIMAGQEYGFPAFQSMTGIHIIKGRPSLSANLMAAAIKRSGRYTFRVAKGHPTDTECSITFFEIIGGKAEEIGTSTFTKADAQKAGTQNMDKFPRNMLYARALSNGVKWYCPDVFNSPVYVPEELGATVGEDGSVIDIQPEPVQASGGPSYREQAYASMEYLWDLSGKSKAEWAKFKAEKLDKATEKALPEWIDFLTNGLTKALREVIEKQVGELSAAGLSDVSIRDVISNTNQGVLEIEELDVEGLARTRDRLATYLAEIKVESAA